MAKCSCFVVFNPHFFHFRGQNRRVEGHISGGGDKGIKTRAEGVEES